MIQRSSVIINPEKSKKFVDFLSSNAKDKAFWSKVKAGASVKVDKRELDKLFER